MASDNKTGRKAGATQKSDETPIQWDALSRILVRYFPYFRGQPYLSSAYCKWEERRITANSVQEFAKILAEKYKDDFTWSTDWTPDFFKQLFYEGFLPIAQDISDLPAVLVSHGILKQSFLDMLVPPGRKLRIPLPKLHTRRTLLTIDSTKRLQFPKQVRKRSKKYEISTDTAFAEVAAACVRQHGENWLFPEMRKTLTSLHSEGVTHSIEIWNAAGELVAGELGYTVGGCYTSLSGFYNRAESGSGTLQLYCLWKLLRGSFKLWDLGMTMKYKTETLGAEDTPREQFLAKLHAVRDVPTTWPAMERTNCKQHILPGAVNRQVPTKPKKERKRHGKRKAESSTKNGDPVSKRKTSLSAGDPRED